MNAIQMPHVANALIELKMFFLYRSMKKKNILSEGEARGSDQVLSVSDGPLDEA